MWHKRGVGLACLDARRRRACNVCSLVAGSRCNSPVPSSGSEAPCMSPVVIVAARPDMTSHPDSGAVCPPSVAIEQRRSLHEHTSLRIATIVLATSALSCPRPLSRVSLAAPWTSILNEAGIWVLLLPRTDRYGTHGKSTRGSSSGPLDGGQTATTCLLDAFAVI